MDGAGAGAGDPQPANNGTAEKGVKKRAVPDDGAAPAAAKRLKAGESAPDTTAQHDGDRRKARGTEDVADDAAILAAIAANSHGITPDELSKIVKEPSYADHDKKRGYFAVASSGGGEQGGGDIGLALALATAPNRAVAAAQRCVALATKALSNVLESTADARTALWRTFCRADPDDVPCIPIAVRVAGGRRFPWHVALQFAAACDLARLASTHRAAHVVCNARDVMARRIVKARHGRGCKAAKCNCADCKRVALLLQAAWGDRSLAPKYPPLLGLNYTEGVARGKVPVLQISQFQGVPNATMSRAQYISAAYKRANGGNPFVGIVKQLEASVNAPPFTNGGFEDNSFVGLGRSLPPSHYPGFGDLRAIALDERFLYLVNNMDFSDSTSYSTRKAGEIFVFTKEGKFVRRIGRRSIGPCPMPGADDDALPQQPPELGEFIDIAVEAGDEGHVYVLHRRNKLPGQDVHAAVRRLPTIEVFTKEGAHVRSISGFSEPDEAEWVKHFEVDGEFLYIGFNNDTYVDIFDLQEAGLEKFPPGVVRVFTKGGEIVRTIGPFNYVNGIALSGDNLYVTDSGTHGDQRVKSLDCVHIVDKGAGTQGRDLAADGAFTDGGYVGMLGSAFCRPTRPGSATHCLAGPTDVTIDPTPGGCVYISDGGRIKIFNQEGAYVRTIDFALKQINLTGSFGEGKIGCKSAAVEPGRDGRIFVLDETNNTVQVYFKVEEVTPTKHCKCAWPGEVWSVSDSQKAFLDEHNFAHIIPFRSKLATCPVVEQKAAATPSSRPVWSLLTFVPCFVDFNTYVCAPDSARPHVLKYFRDLWTGQMRPLCGTFTGAHAGWVFKKGDQGIGYYWDKLHPNAGHAGFQSAPWAQGVGVRTPPSVGGSTPQQSTQQQQQQQ